MEFIRKIVVKIIKLVIFATTQDKVIQVNNNQTKEIFE